MSGEKKRMVEVGGRRKSRRSEELCSTDTVKKADRKPPRSSWAQNKGGRTTERLAGLQRRDAALDLRWAKGSREPSYSQVLTKSVRVTQKVQQGPARRASPPLLQWRCQLFITPLEVSSKVWGARKQLRGRHGRNHRLQSRSEHRAPSTRL